MTQTQNSNSEALARSMTVGEFNDQCDKGQWVKPSEFRSWLKSQGVEASSTAIYYWMNSSNPLQVIKVGGPDGHLWMRREWINDWLARKSFTINGVKVGRFE